MTKPELLALLAQKTEALEQCIEFQTHDKTDLEVNARCDKLATEIGELIVRIEAL